MDYTIATSINRQVKARFSLVEFHDPKLARIRADVWLYFMNPRVMMMVQAADISGWWRNLCN